MKTSQCLLFSLIGLVALFGAACTSDPEPSPTPESPTPPPGDDDTDIVEQITPTPSPTPPPNPLAELTISPPNFQMDLASSLTYQVRAFLQDGTQVNLDEFPLQWASDDPLVATIDGSGVVSPMSPGITLITASAQGVTSFPAELEILPNGQMTVSVVDADSGVALEGVTVYRGQDSSDAQVSDSSGTVTFAGEFSGVQTVTGVRSDYHFASIYEATQKTLVLPLRSKASTTQGRFCGDVDFSKMDTLGNNEIRVGLLTRSFRGNPLTLDTSTIIGQFRTVSICGATTSIPSNVVGELPTYCQRTETLAPESQAMSARLARELAEDPPPTCPALKYELLKYAVPGPSDDYDMYMLAGDLVAQDVINWVTNPDIFTNLGLLLMGIPNMYEFSYEYAQNITVNAPYDTVGITAVADGRTNQALSVKVPAMPSGIDASYPPVVFAIADMGDAGSLPVGIAGANPSTTVPVFFAEEFAARPLYGLVMASEGGVGNDGAYVAVMGKKAAGSSTVTTPPFMPLIQPDNLHTSLSSRTFSFYPAADSTVYRTIFTWRYKLNGVYTEDNWDVYQPTDRVIATEETSSDGSTVTTYRVEVQLPVLPEAYALDADRLFDWEFLGYDNGEQNFHTFSSSSEKTVYDSSLEVERITRNKLYDLKKNL